MSKFARLTPPSTGPTDNADASQLEAITKAIKMLLERLPSSEQERILQELTETILPIPAPRAGEVLGAIVRLLPRKSEWTVDDIKRHVESEGVEARPKEIYNALGYLTRKKHVRRIGYGRYLIDGALLVTSDEVGGEPARIDDDDGSR